MISVFSKIRLFLGCVRAFCLKVKDSIETSKKVRKMAFSKPYTYKIVKEAVDGYPFDYSFLWRIEEAKLEEMENYFKNAYITEDDHIIAKEVELCRKLLHIMNNETDFWHIEPVDGNPFYEWEVKCDVYVNTKNAHRFADSPELIDYYVNKYPSELYVEKARRLYHRLRQKLEMRWSD